MDILSRIRSQFADDRFDANLIAVYGTVVVLVIVSLVLRRLLGHSGSLMLRWTGRRWLHAVGEEAGRHARAVLFWMTLAAAFLTAAGGVAYHLGGRDVRADLGAVYRRMTPEQIFTAGVALGALIALAAGVRFGVWAVRRARPALEKKLVAWTGRAGDEVVLRRWIALLERYAVALVRLTGLWAALEVVGLHRLADHGVAFLIRVVTILVAARLLSMVWGVVSRAAADLGQRHLSGGRFGPYWERIARLFPFGERCLEAAVYVTAASLCVRELHFTFGFDLGLRVVECIGIVFGSRAIIELIQVLLNQACGMYEDGEGIDQKRRTLVPLLQSVCQYVVYFGSAVAMLGVLGVNTGPILAGAGILGLGVGLGAQSLVTDVVSGFFILFESQYLVGDYVEIGEATGTVEAVGIRLTQIRDGQGKLFIIPNGQIKGVVNYSKGYVNAVVDVRVPSGADLEAVFRSMGEAGRRLRQARREVLADTQIHGLVEWGTSEMTVRAVTKVKPGTHVVMQNEYRRLLKQVFDEQPALRKTAA